MKKPIDQCGLAFIHVLLLLINRQLPNKSQRQTRNTNTKSDDGFFRSSKLTNALPDL